MNIETKRLTTRKLTFEDTQKWLEFLQDSSSIEFMPILDGTLKTAEWWIKRQLNRYAEDGYGLMALIEKSTGKFIGQCGLMKQEVEGKTEWEVGYHILKQFRGKGFATEAAAAFKEYAFAVGIADSIVSIIHQDNVGSQKVAERNGMKRDFLTSRYKLMEGIPHYIYRVNKNELFENAYNNPERAASYNQLEFPNTYYLAYRDLPDIIKKHCCKGKAIDFGCGTGRSTRFLKNLGFKTAGVDIAKDMVKLAQKNDPEGDYRIVENGTIGNFDSNSIDLILSVFTFDNLPGIEVRSEILKNMKRVIKENGKIIMLDSNPELYTNDWASFTCSIFPENQTAKSGDIVKVQMEDVPDKRPVEDVIWFEKDYLNLFQTTGMELEATYMPLAKEEEPYDWKNETHIAPWVIYVLKKKTI